MINVRSIHGIDENKHICNETLVFTRNVVHLDGTDYKPTFDFTGLVDTTGVVGGKFEKFFNLCNVP